MTYLFADTALFGIEIAPNLVNATAMNRIKLYEPKPPLPPIYYLQNDTVHLQTLNLFKEYMFEASQGLRIAM